MFVSTAATMGLLRRSLAMLLIVSTAATMGLLRRSLAMLLIVSTAATMGLLQRSLAMLLILILILSSPATQALVQSRDTRALDALLQDHAYRALIRPKTGIIYDGSPPSNMTGVKISSMRLRSGSLRRRGVSEYKEFRIPKGIIVLPRVTRLVLVYQNLGNWSNMYFPLPSGYIYVAPVLGLLAYDARNLSAKNLPELDLSASGQPVTIQFSVLQHSEAIKCVSFDLNGSINFSDIISGDICSTFVQGYFSIVVESATPRKGNGRIGIIVGSVLGGMGLLILLGILAVWVKKCRHRKRMERMEEAAEAEEALEMRNIGNIRAASATVTRTQPSLETEYVP